MAERRQRVQDTVQRTLIRAMDMQGRHAADGSGGGGWNPAVGGISVGILPAHFFARRGAFPPDCGPGKEDAAPTEPTLVVELVRTMQPHLLAQPGRGKLRLVVFFGAMLPSLLIGPWA